MQLPRLRPCHDIHGIGIAHPDGVALDLIVAARDVGAVLCPPFARALPRVEHDFGRKCPHAALEGLHAGQRQRLRAVLQRPLLGQFQTPFSAQLTLGQIHPAEHVPGCRVDAALALPGLAPVIHQAVPVIRTHGLPFAVQRAPADLQVRVSGAQALHKVLIQIRCFACALPELPPFSHRVHPERDLFALGHGVLIQGLLARGFSPRPRLVRRTLLR